LESITGKRQILKSGTSGLPVSKPDAYLLTCCEADTDGVATDL